jgi:hypothetical protein
VLAVVVVLRGRGDDLLGDEGVVGDGGDGTVNAAPVAARELPNDGDCAYGGWRDNYRGFGPVFLVEDEQEGLLLDTPAVAANKGDDVGGLCRGVEVAGGDAGALAGVVGLPDGEVSDGKVLGLENFPVILFDGDPKVVGHGRHADGALGDSSRREGEECREEEASHTHKREGFCAVLEYVVWGRYTLAKSYPLLKYAI